MSVVPIESNPEVINKFLTSLGVSSRWRVTDVYGLTEDLLQSVPRPVLSVLLLFPTTTCAEEDSSVVAKEEKVFSNIYHMRQSLHNACGTVAVIHSVANNLGEIELRDGCLKEFLDTSADLSPEERGAMLKSHVGILDAHMAIADEGQTAAPPPEEEVDHHFVAFVCKDGRLVELDGERATPVVHGPSSPDTLLEDVAEVVKRIVARNPDNLNFTLLALTTASDEPQINIDQLNIESDESEKNPASDECEKNPASDESEKKPASECK